MRACMVAYSFYENDNRVRRCAECLVRRGDQVDAFSLRKKGQPAFEVISGVNVYRLQGRERNEKGPLAYLRKQMEFFLRAASQLTKRHLKKRYDLIHVHTVPDFLVFAASIPRLLGARVILDIHDILPEFYASKFDVSERSFVFRVLLMMEKMSARFADHVISANHLWHDKLIGRCSLPAHRCTAIINYPDSIIFTARGVRIPQDDQFVMCYPGTLNHHQGVDDAVTAVALLREKMPQLRFLIIGDGPTREKLKQMIKEQRLEDRVIMAGVVSMEEVASIMSNVDLGVVPKRKCYFGNEAFSTKILEFMAMGVPVLAGDTRIDQYYFNNDLVQFFDSGNPHDLADKILYLAQNPARREGLRSAGFAFAGKNSWDTNQHEYLNIVDHLVWGSGRPANAPAAHVS